MLKGSSDEFSKVLRSFRRQALHATHIEFKHPVTEKYLAFDANRPQDMELLVNALRQDKKEHPDEF